MKLITDKLKNGFTNPEFTKYLKTSVPKSSFTKDEAEELQKILEAGLKEYPGLGIAATQLGINKRACIINVRDIEMFLLNPVITERSNEGYVFYEGCLSIPKTMETPIRTIRATKIKVETDNLGELEFEINQTEDGKDNQVSTETLMCTVVQHEIDHLDGITIRDRIYSTTVKRNIQFGRNEKIMMKSPEGEFIEVKYKKANDFYLKGYEIV
jgi:peptide deformylase